MIYYVENAEDDEDETYTRLHALKAHQNTQQRIGIFCFAFFQLAFKTSKVVIETRLRACWLLSKLITRLQLLELKGHKVI